MTRSLTSSLLPRCRALGLVVGAALLLGAAAPGRAAEGEPGKAEAALRASLEAQKAKHFRILPVSGASLERLFPGREFFAVRFPQFPVAVLPPPPLRAANLFVAGADGKPRRLSEVPQLQAFFREALPPVRDDRAALAAAQAWLRLAQEFSQDGFFTFDVPADSLRVTTEDGVRTITGKAVVTAGGKGELSARLTFDAQGRLSEVTENRRLLPGIRPICQATKLLDPDPIVRGMAERDILVMGRAAADYLAQQRAGATPALRRAIDRLWRRILDEGW